MKKNDNDNGYNFWPVQLNESIDRTADGTILKRNLMINIRSESPERAIELYQSLKQELSGETEQTEEQTKLTGLEGPETPTCECGAPMVLRQNGKKGNLFWGCSMFPKCRNTMEHQGIESEKEIPF